MYIYVGTKYARSNSCAFEWGVEGCKRRTVSMKVASTFKYIRFLEPKM